MTSRPEAQLTGGYRLLISAAAEILRIAGVLGILISQVWWAALAILSFSVPLFALAVKSGKASYEASKETAKYKRKSYYLADVLTSRETVDERTLFGYSDQINELWHERYETARRIEHQVIKKWFVRSKASGVITALISVLIVVVLLNPVLTGALSVGLFISLVEQHSTFENDVLQLTSYADQLAKHREYLRILRSCHAGRG